MIGRLSYTTEDTNGRQQRSGFFRIGVDVGTACYFCPPGPVRWTMGSSNHGIVHVLQDFSTNLRDAIQAGA